jgi:hypothetical protein
MIAADLARGLDAAAFAESLGITPDDWQRDVLRSTARRRLLLCARQSGKSTTTAVLALHHALYRPGSLILLVSPSLRQSAEMFRKVSELLRRVEQRPRLMEDNRLSFTLAGGSRVVSLPSSEATVRGFSGVDLLIEDEAARVPDSLYSATRPMLATSGGAHILLSTPWGRRGHFHREWSEAGDAWERVRITAHDCPRIPPAFLEEERRSLGDLWFRSEYLVEFCDTVDSVFRSEDIEAALSDDVAPLFASVT